MTVHDNSNVFVCYESEEISICSGDMEERCLTTHGTGMPVQSALCTLNPNFLGHGIAADMLQHFHACVLESGLDISNGPSVNWKFFDNLKTKLFQKFETKAFNIGSCGLDIVHNSFKAGVSVSECVVSEVLSCLYYLSGIHQQEGRTFRRLHKLL